MINMDMLKNIGQFVMHFRCYALLILVLTYTFVGEK